MTVLTQKYGKKMTDKHRNFLGYSLIVGGFLMLSTHNSVGYVIAFAMMVVGVLVLPNIKE